MPPHARPAASTDIADALRERLASGEWPPGTRLPSRTALAEEYAVGPNIVQRAQEELFREELLEGRAGSGTYATQARARHLLRLDPASPYGVRPDLCGEWTVLCRRPGPLTLAYFAEGTPLLLARARTPEPGQPETLLRSATATADDALVLGLPRDAPV